MKPNNGFFDITMSENISVNKVFIYNFVGKLIYIKGIKSNETVDVSTLSSGVYFAEILFKTKKGKLERVVKKFLKN